MLKKVFLYSRGLREGFVGEIYFGAGQKKNPLVYAFTKTIAAIIFRL